MPNLPVNKPNLSPSLSRYLLDQKNNVGNSQRDIQNLQESRAGISLGGGLQAWYYDDTGQTAGSAKGPVLLQEFIGNIDWTNRTPLGLQSTNWTLVAFGYIEFPQQGNHQIRLTYDDGAILTIGNTTLVNDYVSGATRTVTGSYTATDPAPYISPLILTYFQGATLNRLKLEWSISAQPFEVIPKSNLHFQLPAWNPINSTLINLATPYANSWNNYSAYYPARFRMRNDEIELGGAISGGTAPSLAFTLPRPFGSNSFNKVYPVTANNVFGSVQIQGRTVSVQVGAGPVYLDGLRFSSHTLGRPTGSPVTS